VVRLPLKEELNQLGTSRRSAEHRLLTSERRVESDTNFKNQYHQFMKEYEELGHMQPVTTREEGHQCYYLPHHPVVDFNIPTANLEARNVHLALNNQHEDFTQRFSNFNRLLRVTAYCR